MKTRFNEIDRLPVWVSYGFALAFAVAAVAVAVCERNRADDAPVRIKPEHIVPTPTPAPQGIDLSRLTVFPKPFYLEHSSNSGPIWIVQNTRPTAPLAPATATTATAPIQTGDELVLVLRGGMIGEHHAIVDLDGYATFRIRYWVLAATAALDPREQTIQIRLAGVRPDDLSRVVAKAMTAFTARVNVEDPERGEIQVSAEVTIRAKEKSRNTHDPIEKILARKKWQSYAAKDKERERLLAWRETRAAQLIALYIESGNTTSATDLVDLAYRVAEAELARKEGAK